MYMICDYDIIRTIYMYIRIHTRYKVYVYVTITLYVLYIYTLYIYIYTLYIYIYIYTYIYIYLHIYIYIYTYVHILLHMMQNYKCSPVSASFSEVGLGDIKQEVNDERHRRREVPLEARGFRGGLAGCFIS